MAGSAQVEQELGGAVPARDDVVGEVLLLGRVPDPAPTKGDSKYGPHAVFFFPRTLLTLWNLRGGDHPCKKCKHTGKSRTGALVDLPLNVLPLVLCWCNTPVYNWITATVASFRIQFFVLRHG